MAMTSEDEAVPCSVQPKTPCHDCPWRRKAIPGWLGDATAWDWIQTAHSDARIDCHALKGPQCAGAAIYRANVCKKPRDESVLRLPVDRTKVFASPAEFTEHHRPKSPLECD